MVNHSRADFLNYLASHQVQPGDLLPSLSEISSAMGVSIGKLREQVEHARQLGLISSRPRVGTRREKFDFGAAIMPVVLFGMATGEATFAQFSALRQHLESSMWMEAVAKLRAEDKARLDHIVACAWTKLKGEPVHIPRSEHRDFHLTIFCRLGNPFVQGILEAYWNAYEASELTRIASYDYWLKVWDYHQQIAKAIHQDDFEQGSRLLMEHFGLLPTAA